ncbi:hypothetical protein KAF44_30870 [Cupriavidus necator]|nr:hypothetical protein KAF44_30870 [Cupriavidus necator]
MKTEPNTVFTREQLEEYFASYVGMEGEIRTRSLFCDSSPHPRAESMVARWFRTRNPVRGTLRTATSTATTWSLGSRTRIARIMAAARAHFFNTSLGERD